ncbi:MAG: polyphosphate polymerase domain-containing protein [Prevotella sp.]|nr:polyphosphate polymerase domain-containing protein [Prevotella sp.]
MSKQELLSTFTPITLEQMSGIKLMNRIDTKYLLSMEELMALLELAAKDYMVQVVRDERDITYRTVYLDTPTNSMYIAHQCGRTVREKIRVRSYVSSDLTFLEVKNKSNKGRTDKKRIAVTSVDNLADDGAEEFLHKHAWYSLEELHPQLENSFHRVTLVNKAKTERLTIDTNIWFRNIPNGNETILDKVAVVELKRDGLTFSPVKEMLRKLRIQRASFSKYCMGCALTDRTLRQNRFKERIRNLSKYQKIQSYG